MSPIEAFVVGMIDRVRSIIPAAIVASGATVLLLGRGYGLSPDEALTGAAIALTILVVLVKLAIVLVDNSDSVQDVPRRDEERIHGGILVTLASAMMFAACSAWLGLASIVAAIAGPEAVIRPLFSMAGWALLFSGISLVVFVNAMLTWLAWKHRARIATEFQRVFLRTNSEFQNNMRSHVAH